MQTLSGLGESSARPPLRSVSEALKNAPTAVAGEATIRLQLDPAPAAAAEARAAVTLLAGRADPGALDVVRLLVSEIVTNAVRHSPWPADSLIDLAISARDGAVHVDVIDSGPGFVPRPRRPGQSLGSGWGLHLVDCLARRWGVEQGPRPHVWFEVGPGEVAA